MTLNQIIEYVLHSPYNTNPNVLRNMLQAFQSGDNPDLSIITASADKIREGYVGVDQEGERVDGTYTGIIPEGNVNLTSTTSTDVSQYATAQVVDANLVAENIKKDTTVLGVVGTYDNQKTEQTKTLGLSMFSGDQVVYPDGSNVLTQVTIQKPETLIAENIKKDVNIGGIVGTLEGGSGDLDELMQEEF